MAIIQGLDDTIYIIYKYNIIKVSIISSMKKNYLLISILYDQNKIQANLKLMNVQKKNVCTTLASLSSNNKKEFSAIKVEEFCSIAT